MVISVVFIVALVVFMIVQHVWHQGVLNDKRYEHNMSIERIDEALAKEWVKGTIKSDAYLRVINVIDGEHRDV